MHGTIEQMKKPREVVVEWIDHILERKKWNGTDLARKAELAPSTILRLLNDEKHQFIPSLKTLQKIAEASGYPIPRRVTESLGASKMEPPAVAEDEVSDTRRVRASRMAAAPTVQVKHVSSLPKALQSTASSGSESHVPLPPQLDGDDTAFAFYMPDDTFGPWLKAGTMMYATKRRDPVSGDTVMITDRNGKTKVRLLMGIDENGLSLSKTVPAQEDDKMSFDDISEIAVVVIFIKM